MNPAGAYFAKNLNLFTVGMAKGLGILFLRSCFGIFIIEIP